MSLLSYFSFTGTSGTMAWELEKKGVHMVVMWSVPYNLNIYNSYFAVGVVQLTTKFSRDMLPYWYFIYLATADGIRSDLRSSKKLCHSVILVCHCFF